MTIADSETTKLGWETNWKTYQGVAVTMNCGRNAENYSCSEKEKATKTRIELVKDAVLNLFKRNPDIGMICLQECPAPENSNWIQDLEDGIYRQTNNKWDHHGEREESSRLYNVVLYNAARYKVDSTWGREGVKEKIKQGRNENDIPVRFSAVVLDLLSPKGEEMGFRLLVVSYHGQYNGVKIQQRSTSIANFLDRLHTKFTNYPVLIGGDWNYDCTSLLMRTRNKYYKSSGAENNKEDHSWMEDACVWIPSIQPCCRNKGEIDYFVAIDRNPRPKSRANDSLFLQLKDISKYPHLKHAERFDHCPVFATFEFHHIENIDKLEPPEDLSPYLDTKEIYVHAFSDEVRGIQIPLRLLKTLDKEPKKCCENEILFRLNPREGKLSYVSGCVADQGGDPLEDIEKTMLSNVKAAIQELRYLTDQKKYIPADKVKCLIQQLGVPNTNRQKDLKLLKALENEERTCQDWSLDKFYDILNGHRQTENEEHREKCKSMNTCVLADKYNILAKLHSVTIREEIWKKLDSQSLKRLLKGHGEANKMTKAELIQILKNSERALVQDVKQLGDKVQSCMEVICQEMISIFQQFGLFDGAKHVHRDHIFNFAHMIDYFSRHEVSSPVEEESDAYKTPTKQHGSQQINPNTVVPPNTQELHDRKAPSTEDLSSTGSSMMTLQRENRPQRTQPKGHLLSKFEEASSDPGSADRASISQTSNLNADKACYNSYDSKPPINATPTEQQNESIYTQKDMALFTNLQKERKHIQIKSYADAARTGTTRQAAVNLTSWREEEAFLIDIICATKDRIRVEKVLPLTKTAVRGINKPTLKNILTKHGFAGEAKRTDIISSLEYKSEMEDFVMSLWNARDAEARESINQQVLKLREGGQTSPTDVSLKSISPFGQEKADLREE